jgi:steroid delta-isomerase-like uncharacterized protein
MTETEKQLIRVFVDEVANGRDLDRLGDLLSDDFTLPIGDLQIDRAGLGGILTYYFAAFPDLHYEIKEIVAEGDVVVTRVRMTGSHTGAEYAGHAASGRSFAVDEIDIFRVTDGRIASYSIVWDELGFRRQLGLSLNG